MRELISRLKFGNERRLAQILGRHLARQVAADGDVFDLVTWAPTSDRRRRRRGFDQSELVAQTVARELGIPCRRVLRRDISPAQTGRSRVERLQGPEFSARPLWRHTRVLIVDDVTTTGATLRAAARAVEAAGGSPATVALAATPRRDV